jgi:hypothetical protein
MEQTIKPEENTDHGQRLVRSAYVQVTGLIALRALLSKPL